MIEFQVFNVALGSMDREHARIRQAANRIAASNLHGENGTDNAAFSKALNAVSTSAASGPVGSTDAVQSVSTLDEMTTIMTSSRLYEANVTVVSAARSAFEKALEISGRR